MDTIREFRELNQQISDNTDKQKACLFKIVTILLFISSYPTFLPSVFYKDPIFICKSSLNSTYHCTQQDACTQFYKSNGINATNLTEYDNFDFTQIIDQQQSINSLTTKFQLVCNKQVIKIGLIKQFFKGALCAFTFQLLIKVNNKTIRKVFIIIALILILISSLVIILIDQLYLNSYALAIKMFVRQALHTMCFDFIKDYYKVNYLSYYQITQNMGYTFAMFFFPVINYFINSNYHQLILIVFLSEIVFIPCFIYYSIGIVEDIVHKQQVITNLEEYPIKTNIMEISSIITKLDPNFIIVLMNVYLHRLYLSVFVVYLDFTQFPNLILMAQGLLSFYIGIKLNRLVNNNNEYRIYQRMQWIVGLILLSTIFISPSLQFNNQMVGWLFQIMFSILLAANSVNQTLMYLILPYFVEVQYFTIIFNSANVLQRVTFDSMIFYMYYLRQQYDIQVISGIGLFLISIYFINKRLKRIPVPLNEEQQFNSIISHLSPQFSLFSNPSSITLIQKSVYSMINSKNIMLQDFSDISVRNRQSIRMENDNVIKQNQKKNKRHNNSNVQYI